MPKDSSLHKKVQESLIKLEFTGYDLLIERRKGRLDLPDQRFQSGQKEVGQRERNLCYTDAIIHTEGKPRLMLEVVHNNPTRPNGITGLTVNVDRVAAVHPNIDLMYVVLAGDMKAFFCREHKRGHRRSPGFERCLQKYLRSIPEGVAYRELIREGVPANFKKALVDYPITDYLRNMPPPSVLFLNANKARNDWDSYEPHALQLIKDEIDYIISSPERRETHLVGIIELIPNHM